MEKYQVVKFVDDDFTLDVRADSKNETVWLSLNDLCFLFDKDKSVISRHISNIFREKELYEKQTVAKNATVQIEEEELDESVVEESSVTASDGKTYRTKIYNLDMIISVGYRVESKRGIAFRKWASKVLKDKTLRSKNSTEGSIIDPQSYIT